MFHPFRTGRLPPQWPVSQTLSPTLASLPTLRSLNGLVLKGGFGWTTEPTESAETADRRHTKRVLVARMRSGDFETKDKITGWCSWVPPYSFFVFPLLPPRRWRPMSAELDPLIALGNDM